MGNDPLHGLDHADRISAFTASSRLLLTPKCRDKRFRLIQTPGTGSVSFDVLTCAGHANMRVPAWPGVRRSPGECSPDDQRSRAHQRGAFRFMSQNPKPTESDEVENVHSEAQEVAEATNDESILAFIEIPRGSRNKYEFDEESGTFHLDRVLYSSVHYPTDYGFIPDTLADDGDHLDVLVLMTEPSFPGCTIEARALGGLDMSDEKGRDFKVLAVPVNDPRFNHYQTLDQVGKHWLKEIETFFATYKLLEKKKTDILGWHGIDFARQQIEESRSLYREKHPLAEK